MLEQQLVNLLIKLAVAAALASILVRANFLRRALLRDGRTLVQRVQFALGFAAIFGAGVATRVATGVYKAVDLGLEGSLLAGILGGYVSGLIAGVLISLPAMMFAGEYLTMALFAGVGVLGGLLRDLAPDPEEIWRFSPFFDLSLYRMLRKSRPARTRLFHLAFLSTILFAECLRWIGLHLFGPAGIFALYSPGEWRASALFAVFISTVFAVTSTFEGLERHSQRGEARIAAAAVERSPARRAYTSDQSPFPLQYPELDRIAHPDRP